MIPVAALYADPRGVYASPRDVGPGVTPWGLPDRDAREYAGPDPVVAHPPCAAWGRFSKPTPESKARGPLRGDDGGTFAAALAALARYGGVLEHPRDTSSPPPIGTGARRGNLESMSKRQRAATPPAFAAVLVALARWSTGVDAG